MRRLAYAVLAVAVPLALAAPAVAKEATKARVCGKSDCVTTKDRGILALFMEGGPPSEPPSAGAAWYRVDMTIDTGDGNRETFPMIVSPRLRLGGSSDAGSYNWFALSNEAAKGYARLARTLEARPPSSFPGLDGPRAGTPAAARVDEVVQPPAPADGSDAPIWPWLLAAAGLGILGVGAVALGRRTRRGRRPDSTGTDPLTP
jgi:hypothetical protein